MLELKQKPDLKLQADLGRFLATRSTDSLQQLGQAG